jgi:response regulator RpfG family c-di-GMP phosphodiesterase
MNFTYYPVPILHLLKHQSLFSGIEIYVKIAEKYVRLNFAEEPYQDILNKLLTKSVEHVYLNEEDFLQILNAFNEHMLSGEVSESTFNEEIRANTADALFTMSREFMKSHGVNSELVGSMAEANKSIQTLIKKAENLNSFLKKFEKECSEEFIKIGVTNFLSTAVINQFPWKSQQIIEKTMLAGLFCDIMLEPKDFDRIIAYETTGEELPLEIKRHPLKAINLLAHKLDVIPQETLTIIEQHHERPDGTGFPTGIDISRFNQLSAIFIVCQRFTDELFIHEFNSHKYMESIQSIRSNYEGAVFSRALEALVEVVNVDALKQ